MEAGMGSEQMQERERPSRHGKILGQFLSAVADAGRREVSDGVLVDMCSTCAFRDGAMPNQMAATGLVAFKIVMGIDTDQFACHHGMKDGTPQKICAGYALAKLAPWSIIQAEGAKLRERMDAASGPDEVRSAFDAWLNEVDPDRKLDDYALARLFARDAGRLALAQALRNAPTEAGGEGEGGGNG
jgi:hypothetical protein